MHPVQRGSGPPQGPAAAGALGWAPEVRAAVEALPRRIASQRALTYAYACATMPECQHGCLARPAHLIPQALPKRLELPYELLATRLIVLCADGIPHIGALELLSGFEDGKEICRITQQKTSAQGLLSSIYVQNH